MGAEQEGYTHEMEVIEQGNIQGYTSTSNDHATVLLYSNYGDHIDVEYYAYSDSMDTEALQEDVGEFKDVLEAELAEIEA